MTKQADQSIISKQNQTQRWERAASLGCFATDVWSNIFVVL